MNLYSATVETFRRFTVHHQPPRIIEKRTYVIVLVPFDFRGNGHARKTSVAQSFIDNVTDSDHARSDTPAALTVVDRPKILDASVESNEPELNYDLVWTWFLPNPLWPPKKRK